MALDKQRILNELGSVMNQLQSADCGCIGKLFSNSGQASTNQATSKSPYTGCNHGACHCHGYCMHSCNDFGNTDPSAGEPNSGNVVYNNNNNANMYNANNNANMNQPCMGQCNPAKLYSDTYNYLNHNLMQPVVQEVYNDLKSINATNTVMNNPLASKMGLSQQNPAVTPVIEGNMGNVCDPNMSSQMPKNDNMNFMMSNTGQSPGTQGHNHMAGMGPQIVKMVMGEGKPTYNNMQTERSEFPGMQNYQTAESGGASNYGQMMVDAQMANTNSSNGFQQNSNTNANTVFQQQSSTNPSYYMQQGQGIANANLTGQQLLTQQNQGMKLGQEMTNFNPHGQLSQQGQGITPASLAGQKTPAATHNQSYGIHSQGMKKFNEMFPGVAQGDLGFDPMAIAIQMNPANQQQVAMNTMQKLMNNNSAVQNAFNAHPNAVTPQPGTSQNPQYASNVPQTTVAPVSQQNVVASVNQGQNNFVQSPEIGYQQGTIENQLMQQHQVYQTQAPVVYQQDNNQEQLMQQRDYARSAGYVQQGDSIQQGNLNTPVPTSHLNQNKEPLLPVDTSKNVYDPRFNTLGQPVEMLPGKIYKPSIPPLPQTLSPQPIPLKLSADPTKYSNVKSTVSKTSLIGNRQLGMNPSRSQLQHIYNQYKGSQSYTQQNVTSNNQGGRYSDVQLRQPTEPKAVADGMPIEKTGGDTTVNNKIASDYQLTKQEVTEHIGDVPNVNQRSYTFDKPQYAKCRNGLQDVVYTSYPTTAAWTFRGKNHPFVSSTQGMLRSRSPHSRKYLA